MDGYHYYNIFATKGSEYLLTIVFFLMLIPFWIILNKKAKPAMATKTVPNIFGNISAIPQQLYMALNQIWVQPFEGNQLRLGFNDLISNLVHAEKLVFKKNIGESIVRGELLAELHSNGKQLKIVSPVSGIVRKTNKSLEYSASLSNASPYQHGWMMEVEAANWSQDVKTLITPDSVKSWMINELTRARDYFLKIQNSYNPVAQPIVLQDGGELNPDALSKMPATVWNDFEEAFLSLPQQN
ncbi:MAG: hypothetical protein H0S84_12610 [Bacteroidales bacterium]|nr:hypothetical protein [Bacteroidales bacterium]MDN5350310.1 glycine cleavage system protein [Bacteroidales bacterium]